MLRGLHQHGIYPVQAEQNSDAKPVEYNHILKYWFVYYKAKKLGIVKFNKNCKDIKNEIKLKLLSNCTNNYNLYLNVLPYKYKHSRGAEGCMSACVRVCMKTVLGDFCFYFLDLSLYIFIWRRLQSYKNQWHRKIFQHKTSIENIKSNIEKYKRQKSPHWY